jgi:aminoglycoside phosphotransferase (APT) family kinase protein
VSGIVPAPADWKDLVDLARLRNWMDAACLGAGPIVHVQPLTGGTQNVLLKFEREGRGFVLRRPPPHPYMDGNQAIVREARMLRALFKSGIPHPQLIAACEDSTVIGAAFFLMEPVVGFNATVEMPLAHASSTETRHAMGLALADVIAALGNIDHSSVGLSLRGTAEGYLQRQITRWRSQLQRYGEYSGWPGPSALPGVDFLQGWLTARCPESFVPGIVHGDYHLGNVLFDCHSSRIAAVVDWELSTVGDPLLDLGWLIATWPNPDGSKGTCIARRWDGFPTVGELIDRYRRSSARDMSTILWNTVLACFKLGILLEGSYARACAGLAPKHVGADLHMRAITLFERASEYIADDGLALRGTIC